MSSIQEKLYIQAQELFSSQQLVELEPGIFCYLYTLTLRQTYSLRRFYILFNIYFLQKPNVIVSYLTKSPPSQEINIIEFLQALKSLSYVLRPNTTRYKNLKQAYEMILSLDQVKAFISNYCLIPENIADFIQGLGLRKQALIDLQTKVQENSPAKNNQKPSHDIILGYSKVTVLIANIKESYSQLDFDKFWVNITSVAQNHNLCYMKIFDIFIRSLFLTDNMTACRYVLKKYKTIMKSQQMVKFILSKMEKKYFQDGKLLVYENKKLIELQSLKRKNESIPNQQFFKTLALLVKAQFIQVEPLFSLLTPSVKQIAQIQRQRYEIQKIYSKKFYKKSVLQSSNEKPKNQLIWGYMNFSSKLQFLNHLLLVNNFKPFKEIVTKNVIKIDLLYHPNILETLCDLFEWIIQPLYEQLDITQHFKGKKGFYKQFPEGFFKQVFSISHAMISYLSQIIEIGKSYIFSSRTTFIKICRIFHQVCSKNSKIQFEQSDINKKIVTYIANTIKRHILPALQYYERDPAIVNELDRLMNSFKFKVQFQIYHECLKEHQFLNLHLTVLKEETTSQLVRYLNRLTDTDAVMNLIRKLLVCHVFSSLQQIIFVRFQFISKEQVRKIIEAIKKTPKFTKKVSLFFVFIQLCEYQKDMLTSDKEISKKYEHLITFTQSLLHFQKKNEQFMKLILDYFTYKLLNFSTDIKLLNNFDKFHGYIYFLDGLLENLLPIQLDDCSINQFDRKYLTGGPYLKIKLMKKIKQFNESRSLRESMIKCFFKPHIKCILQNTFYFIILKLSTIQQFIVKNLQYNQPTTSFLQDKFLKLILNIINIAHFQTYSAEISKYFKYKLFEPLVLYYKLPYEISFYIIRKSLTQQMSKSGYDWNQQKNWKQLKEYFIPSLKNHFKQSKAELLIPDENSYSQQQMNYFLDLDVFLLFWIQDPQYALYLNYYSLHIDDLQKIILQLGENCDKNLILFRAQLIKEKQKFAKIYYDLTFEKGSNGTKPRYDYNKRYIIFESEQYNLQEKFVNFCKMFIKFCIIPRAMLNKSECYYCSCFFLYFLKKNNLPIEISTKLICLLLQQITKHVAISSQRESSQLLPLLYNSSMAPFTFWHNFARFNDKLDKLQLINRKMSFDVYIEVLYVLYESQTKILNYFFECRNDAFRIKKSLNFLFKCQSIPFCSNHGQMIMNGFEEIKALYKQHKDVIVMVESYTKQFQNKLSLTRSIQDSVRRRYDSKHNRNHSNSLNQTNPDIYYNVKSEDPFDEYPNLSTSVDFSFSQTQKKQKYTSKASTQKRSSPSVTFERQIIEEQPVQEQNRRKSGNNFSQSQKRNQRRSSNRESSITVRGKNSQSAKGKSRKSQPYK